MRIMATYSEQSEWTLRRSGTELSRPVDHRPPYARDRARIIHSAAFRRLQAKTQVLGIGEGDFHRTRLTHSMEVAQVARGIVHHLKNDAETHLEWKAWLPGLNLIEAIGLSHDLGHPPFGHGGEVALNYAMRLHGGFEGNGQTLRLLARLEAHSDEFGLDLTRRTLFGILKYPVPYEAVRRRSLAVEPDRLSRLKADDWKPPKCFFKAEADVVDWILEPFTSGDRAFLGRLKEATSDAKHGKPANHGLDTSIMELGDDIAYGVHDLEDAIALGMIQRSDWDTAVVGLEGDWYAQQFEGGLSTLGDQLFGVSSHGRKRAIGALVNAFITSTRLVSREAKLDHMLLRLHAKHHEPAHGFLERLKDLVNRKVIKTPQVQTLEYRGQQLVLHLFDAVSSDPLRLLPAHFAETYKAEGTASGKIRTICDYVAGMTDEYATRMYERLFVPRRGASSDRL